MFVVVLEQGIGNKVQVIGPFQWEEDANKVLQDIRPYAYGVWSITKLESPAEWQLRVSEGK
jgi:hypothetical protein